MFLHISQQMISKVEERARNTPGLSSTNLGSGSRTSGITVIDESLEQPRQKSGCCGGGRATVVEGQPDPRSP